MKFLSVFLFVLVTFSAVASEYSCQNQNGDLYSIIIKLSDDDKEDFAQVFELDSTPEDGYPSTIATGGLTVSLTGAERVIRGYLASDRTSSLFLTFHESLSEQRYWADYISPFSNSRMQLQCSIKP